MRPSLLGIFCILYLMMLQTKKHADGKTQSDRILLVQNTFLSRLHLVIDAGQATFEIMSIDMFLVLNRLTMLLQLLLEAKLDSVILRSWLKNATTKPGLQANNVVSTLETLSYFWWTKLRTRSPSSQITIAEGSFCCFFGISLQQKLLHISWPKEGPLTLS